MGRHWLVIVLSVAASLAFALSSSFKHVSAGRAPDAQTLRPGRLAVFMRVTLSHRLWLFAIGFDLAGLALQITALHLGALVVVQPLLTCGLVFALIFRRAHDHHNINRRELGWAILLTASLAVFVGLTVRRAGNPQTADRVPAIIAAVVGLVLVAGCVEIGRRQTTHGRAAAFLGVAAGTIYAGTAALLKALSDVAAAHGVLHIFVGWQLYCVVPLGLLGLMVNQVAFQAGSMAASLSAASTVDPLLSIVIGILVYDEHVRPGPGGGAVLVGSLVLLGVAAIQLARSKAEPLEEPA